MTSKGDNKGIFSGLSEVKMNELRKMIIGLDNEDMKRLALFINDPEAFSAEISELLPNSINLMLESGKISYSELVPAFESILQDSIKKDPHTLANILFPIMMPAIRKAVAEDLKKMIDSLNTTLEHGFSPKRIGWRFQALFSGKTYAEIVLSHAYIFRVRQVFLIHKKSGLLLNDVVETSQSVTKDADMVSSMLSAIKDFVQDSFDVEGSSELNTINVGQFNIWIEQGPEAIIATIVDGDASAELREQMKDAIEKIHLKYSQELRKFDGDTDVFAKTEPYLENCLLSEQKETKKRKPLTVIIIFILALLGLVYLSYLSVDKYLRMSNMEDSLNSKAGILITDDESTDGKTVFLGLRDPLSENPYAVAEQFGFDTADVHFKLKSYISLDISMVLKHAYAVLNPPEKVKLRMEGQTLFISGEADEEWVEMAKLRYYSIQGVNKLNIQELKILTNKTFIEKRMLSIEDYYFEFKYLKVELTDEQKIKFANLIDEVNEVLDFNFSQDSVPVIVVIAHTSYEGNAEANKRVAFERAQEFINLMINADIPMEVLVPKTDYVEDINYKYPVRSVSFKVIYSKPEDL